MESSHASEDEEENNTPSDNADDDDDGDEADRHDLDAPPTAEDYADASYLDAAGYVVCTLEPYASMKASMIGRITSWPCAVPEEKRNVSCSCFLHGGCKSPARKRRMVSNRDFLIWLYSGVHEPGCSGDRRKELRAMHVSSFPKSVEPNK